MNAPEPSDPVSYGVRAANLLEEACRLAPGSAKAPQLQVVRVLALDIGRQLDALAGLTREEVTPDVLAEAALCCADLANLAACNAPDLPPDAAPHAAEAARLAARAVGALGPMVEAGSGDPGTEHAGNLLRDMRSAAWRAGFASRLVEGPSGKGPPD
jgi:hypothetical protein